MTKGHELEIQSHRRTFLTGGIGVGSLALASLLGRQANGELATGVPFSHSATPHFPAKAKRVIFLCMAG